MTRAIKIIWLTAAIIWSPILIAKAFSAECQLPCKLKVGVSAQMDQSITAVPSEECGDMCGKVSTVINEDACLQDPSGENCNMLTYNYYVIEDDKWEKWSPPPMHTDAEMMAILNSGVHICEISQSGPCEGVVILRPETLNQIEPASGE